jgi:hypothetical protein
MPGVLSRTHFHLTLIRTSIDPSECLFNGPRLGSSLILCRAELQTVNSPIPSPMKFDNDIVEMGVEQKKKRKGAKKTAEIVFKSFE